MGNDRDWSVPPLKTRGTEKDWGRLYLRTLLVTVSRYGRISQWISDWLLHKSLFHVSVSLTVSVRDKVSHCDKADHNFSVKSSVGKENRSGRGRNSVPTSQSTRSHSQLTSLTPYDYVKPAQIKVKQNYDANLFPGRGSTDWNGYDTHKQGLTVTIHMTRTGTDGYDTHNQGLTVTIHMNWGTDILLSASQL